jgi:F-type H+-transporting ATPase subunit epsilon
MKLEIVTAERPIYSDEVDMVVAPGALGELGILPHHASLMTMIDPGELRVKKGKEELSLAVSGGFLEVHKDKIIILADTAERAEEIDEAKASQAKERALELLKSKPADTDLKVAEAALRKSLAEIKAAERRRARRKQKVA